MLRRSMAICAILTLWVSGSAYAAAPPIYYLALGDSLSRGVQPTRTGVLVETNQGYVDDLYAYYRLRHPDLRLAKLGCSGETTGTMIAGGVCSYPLGSQLNQAVDFIQTHRVALVTLTIGGDNILHCINADAITTQVIDPACVAEGVADLGPESTILAAFCAPPPLAASSAGRLDRGDATTTILCWASGGSGRGTGARKQYLCKSHWSSTALLEAIYGAFHVPVADVAQAFRITDLPDQSRCSSCEFFLAFFWRDQNLPPHNNKRRGRVG